MDCPIAAPTTWRIRRAFVSTAALLMLLLCGALASAGSASASNGKVLILEPTVQVQESGKSREAEAAEEAGEGVDVATPAQWEALTASQFAEYDAVILGDPNCTLGTEPLAAAEGNSAVWSAAVTGNVIVIGTDPDFHSNEAVEGAKTLIKTGVAFAVENKGHTGAYIDLSCYYAESGLGTEVPVLASLSSFGGFKVFGQFQFSSCPEESHIVATSPALSGLTDEALSNWNCSAHEAFEEWPADFEVLAINKNIGENFTASDGTKGGPYILSRGATVISNIALTPVEATNPLGAEHTLTATVTEDEKPVVGTTVTFEVIAGPNKGLKGTALTNEEGKATFSYTSSVPGTDVIHATFVDAEERTETSNTAEKTWVEEESPCTEAHGVGHTPPRGAEGLNEGNRLNTSLAGKERLEVTFPARSAHFHLSHLESASCISIPGGHEFQGRGTGKLNHAKGYEAVFSIAQAEGKITFHIQIAKEGTILLDTGFVTLTKGSKEHFA
jgi:Bacterial Ig-like domain (group 1)